MSANPIESGVGLLNYRSQASRGTIAAAASTAVGTARPRWVGGGLQAHKKLASEEYVDGNRFGSPSTMTDMLDAAAGTLTIQAQPETAGLFFCQILNSDVVTGASDPYTHTIASNVAAAGEWGTWWQESGATVKQREAYYDAKIAKLAWSIGASQNFAHMDMDIMALKLGEIFTTVPTKTEATTDPFIWPEITGSCVIDGLTLTDVEEDLLTIDTGMEAFYGDSHEPAQLIEKKGTIVRSVKTIVTDQTLQEYNKTIYGTTSPTAGTRPVKTVLYAGIQTVLTKSATRTLTINTPNVAIDPADMAVFAQPDGGKVEISFGGNALKNGATAQLTVTALTADATGY